MKNNSKIKKIIQMKGQEQLACLTSYTGNVAKIVDKHCDIILVGDSVATAHYGMASTKQINIDTMIMHAKSVVKQSKKSLVVVDMPFGSYLNKKTAFQNAKKIMLTGCDAVKLEGGLKIANIIKHLIKKGIPVLGHIGLLPQHIKSGFHVYGNNEKEKRNLIFDALALERSGVFAIVLECINKNLALQISTMVSVPTIGIGSSVNCDGQVLVIDDILGMSNFKAKFVKKYTNISKQIDKSVKKYCYEVKKKMFPNSKYTY
tara:strand:- start:1500 stop:2279 length:780 start_codon:yes stop_codon:yes gene_type:complete